MWIDGFINRSKILFLCHCSYTWVMWIYLRKRIVHKNYISTNLNDNNNNNKLIQQSAEQCLAMCSMYQRRLFLHLCPFKTLSFMKIIIWVSNKIKNLTI